MMTTFYSTFNFMFIPLVYALQCILALLLYYLCLSAAVNYREVTEGNWFFLCISPMPIVYNECIPIQSVMNGV